jgi:hypothetical protein
LANILNKIVFLKGISWFTNHSHRIIKTA